MKPIIIENFEDFIKNLPNIAENSPHIAEVKLKICESDKRMKDFVKVFWNCCFEDSQLAELAMKFCKHLSENPKFKEILSTFIKMLSCFGNYNTLVAMKFVINLYKNGLVDISTIKSWLTTKILEKFSYNEIFNLSELLNDLDCNELSEQISNVDNLMHEKFMEMCSTIKSDLEEFI